jgi:sulfur-oxidizing protein SoxB
VKRREFLQGLAAAAVAGLPIDASRAAEGADGEHLYDALRPFGNVGLLHITDCHAQLKPTRFREPSVNLGAGSARGKPPHLVGESLHRHFRNAPGTRAAQAFTHLAFERAARA